MAAPPSLEIHTLLVNGVIWFYHRPSVSPPSILGSPSSTTTTITNNTTSANLVPTGTTDSLVCVSGRTRTRSYCLRRKTRVLREKDHNNLHPFISIQNAALACKHLLPRNNLDTYSILGHPHQHEYYNIMSPTMAMTMPTAMYAPTSDVMDRHEYGITKSRKSSSTGGGRAWSEDEVRLYFAPCRFPVVCWRRGGGGRRPRLCLCLGEGRGRRGVIWMPQ